MVNKCHKAEGAARGILLRKSKSYTLPVNNFRLWGLCHFRSLGYRLVLVEFIHFLRHNIRSVA